MLTHKGTKREYFKTWTGEFLDISDWGILRSEWDSRKNKSSIEKSDGGE